MKTILSVLLLIAISWCCQNNNGANETGPRASNTPAPVNARMIIERKAVTAFPRILPVRFSNLFDLSMHAYFQGASELPRPITTVRAVL